MSVRSFTIFQDVSSAIETDTAVPTSKTPSTPSRHLAPILPAKENLHPVTGSSSHPSKKRRVSNATVLVTKFRATSAAEEKENGCVPKRGKSPFSSKGNSLTKSGKSTKGKEEKSRSSSRPRSLSRSTSSRSIACRTNSHAIPEVIAEEEEEVSIHATATQHDTATQALIDARCYELTVAPLADVSTAYDVVEGVGIDGCNVISSDYRHSKDTVGSDNESSLTPSSSSASVPSSSTAVESSPIAAVERSPLFTVFRDDQSALQCGSPTFKRDDVACSPKKGSQVASLIELSTPERRSIYASFTFSSPIRSPKYE